MTEATPDGTAMFALAIDIKEGKIAWRKQIFTNAEVEEAHIMNSYASPSPATDGKNAWVHFGSYGTACLSLATGDIEILPTEVEILSATRPMPFAISVLLVW
jgi:hypothetical protein